MALQLIFALYPLCLAGAGLFWTLTARSGRKSRWTVDLAAGASIVAFAFLAGPWALTSYYLRYAVLGLFPLAVLHSWRRMRENRAAGGLAVSGSVLVVFVVLDALTIASRFESGEALELTLPLGSGSYYVLQGGTSLVTNPFHALGGSPQALDIVKLNPWGSRAKGLAPGALHDYEIFGDRVHSPCEGTVLAVRGNLPDNPPGQPDAEHPEGNYVTLKCGEAELLLAHLMQGSPRIAAGQTLAPGQPLGRVGNSGNSLEPHLHVSARKRGMDVGLVFDGRRLSLNSVVSGTQGGGRPDAGR